MDLKNIQLNQSGYVATLQYLNRVNTPVSPHDLALTLKKSRVTIQAALKRLVHNGWVIKEGTSPRALYRAVDPFAKSRPVAETIPKTNPDTIQAFIDWCRTNRYHVPEITLEYQQYVQVKGKK